MKLLVELVRLGRGEHASHQDPLIGCLRRVIALDDVAGEAPLAAQLADRTEEVVLQAHEAVEPLQASAFRMHVSLVTQLGAINASASQCTGDGNLDRVVDTEDVLGWARFSELNDGKSSWFDFNLDGVTDGADLAVISDNYGAQCPIGRWAR